MDIFNILKQNTDDVIMIINYFIEVSDQDAAATIPAPAPASRSKKQGLDDFWNYV